MLPFKSCIIVTIPLSHGNGFFLSHLFSSSGSGSNFAAFFSTSSKSIFIPLLGLKTFSFLTTKKEKLKKSCIRNSKFDGLPCIFGGLTRLSVQVPVLTNLLTYCFSVITSTVHWEPFDSSSFVSLLRAFIDFSMEMRSAFCRSKYSVGSSVASVIDWIFLGEPNWSNPLDDPGWILGPKFF